MASNFLGGLALAYEGAQQGIQAGIKRRERAEDRAAEMEDREWVRGQRGLQRAQQQRAADEQAREDKLQNDLRAIPSEKSVTEAPPVPNDDEGNPMPGVTKTVERTQEEQLREIAELMRGSGKIDRWLQASATADKLGEQRSQAAYRQLAASASGMSTPELARAFGRIYEADPHAGSVKAFEEVPGGVRVVLRNKLTGQEQQHEFIGDEGRRKLLALGETYFSPAEAAARMEEARKLRLEMAKNAGRVTAVPGGYAVNQGDGTVRSVVTQAGGGKSGGADRAVQAPDALAQSILTGIWKNAEDKPTQQQQAVARDIVATLFRSNSGITPERAAKVANAVSQNPAAATPMVDPQTGEINQAFQDEDGSRYIVRRNFVRPEEAEQRGISKDAMREAAAAMLRVQGSMETQRRLVAAAFDQGAADALVADVRAAAQGSNGLVMPDDAERVTRQKLALLRLYGAKNWAGGAPRAPGAPSVYDNMPTITDDVQSGVDQAIEGLR